MMANSGETNPVTKLKEAQVETQNVVELIPQINDCLRAGIGVAELSPWLSQLPKPIIVDFNGVLVNEGGTVANPLAKEGLDQLKDIGTVVVLTVASGWSGVKNILQQNGLWGEKILLVTKGNLGDSIDAMSWEEMPENIRDLRQKYVELAKEHELIPEETLQKIGHNIDAFDAVLGRGISFKRVAPILQKPYLVPIIDDTYQVVANNPGMKGVFAKEFSTGNLKQQVGRLEPCDLYKAVDVVREHYSAITE